MFTHRWNMYSEEAGERSACMSSSVLPQRLPRLMKMSESWCLGGGHFISAPRRPNGRSRTQTNMASFSCDSKAGKISLSEGGRGRCERTVRTDGLRKEAQNHSLPLLVASSWENNSKESPSELMNWNFMEFLGNAMTNSDWRELVINFLFQSEFKLPHEEMKERPLLARLRFKAQNSSL